MLETKNLCRTYRPKNGVPVKALDNVNLTLAERGMVFILGKSGSGKSTFLNVLGGLDKYDEGELIVYGKSSKDFSQSEFDSYRNTYIGFVFQEYNIMQEFSVGQNIALAIQLQGKKATREAVAEILDKVDLKGYEDRKTNELSGGQKQRVAIARALIKDPKIIMADEPTGALDSRTGEQVFDTLKKLSEDKLVLVVSHDRDFAERYADRIIEFSDGKVISDTTKTEIAATPEGEKISVVDGKILQIKGGSTLTQEDLEVINSYLKANENDTFISLDGNLNKELRKVSKINESGAKDAFRKTEKEDVDVKAYGEDDFKTIKSRLPLKNSLRIAASSLKAKPVRLFFTIILSAIAFTLFGLMAVFSNYDKKVAYIETFSDLGTETVYVMRTSKVYYFADEYYMDPTSMKPEELAALNADFAEKGIPFVGVAGSYISFYESLGEELGKYGSYYRTDFNGISTVTEEQLDKFGYTLYGSLPQEKNEIAVTDYFFDVYKTSYSERISSTLTSFSSLIGETVTVNRQEVKITAVIDTHFDSEERYKPFKTHDGTSEMSHDEILNLDSQFDTDLASGLFNVCFVSEKFMSDFEFDNTVYYFDKGYGGYHNMVYGEEENRIRSAYPLSSLTGFENDRECVFYYPDGKNFGDNSVVLSILDNSVSDRFRSIYQREIDDMEPPESFTDEEYERYKVEYNNRYIGKLSMYMTYLARDGWENNQYAEDSGKTVMRNTLLKAAEKCWQSMTEEEKTVSLKYYQWVGDTEIATDIPIKVSGIYIGELATRTDSLFNIYPNTVRSDYYGAVFYSENIANSMNSRLDGPYVGAVAKLPEDKSELRSFVEYFDGIKDEKGWTFLSNATTYIDFLDFVIQLLLDIFLVAGIVIAFFAAFLMMNFIATSIVYKKREIGILRAVGARGLDVFGIFFNEAMIIAVINFAVATLFMSISVFSINTAIRAGMPIAITLFAISAVPLILVLSVSILTAFVASFIPSFRISLKRPIDAIQNR